MQNRAEFLAGLPRRRIAAGALIRDHRDRVCLVEPTYKKLWNLPGGTVETDESPKAGCRRELLEELGIDLEIGPMLCMDWVAPGEDDPHGALIFVYDGGVVDQSIIDTMITPPEELYGFAFVADDDLGDYLSVRNQQRIHAARASIGGPVAELG
ncbi:MAG: NUDIX hydrolase [Microlunatus sp.]|nr:NUDIX hydrolase [Microlunatus sp.]